MLKDALALFGYDLNIDQIGQGLSIEPMHVGIAIALVAILIVGIRRRRNAARLRAELNRITSRIAELEAAENRRLLISIKSGPLVPEQVAETAAVEAPNVHRLSV